MLLLNRTKYPTLSMFAPDGLREAVVEIYPKLDRWT